MKNPTLSVTDTLITSTFAGLGTALVSATMGKTETGSTVAPLNATSHIVWGEREARRNRVDLKHTAVGAVLNVGAMTFWASVQELVFGKRLRRSGPGTSVGVGALMALAAYLVDYHLVPRRFTPGFEKRLSGPALAAIYTGFGTGLTVGGMIAAARGRRRFSRKRKLGFLRITR
jgi:hypothetical protein